MDCHRTKNILPSKKKVSLFFNRRSKTWSCHSFSYPSQSQKDFLFGTKYSALQTLHTEVRERQEQTTARQQSNVMKKGTASAILRGNAELSFTSLFNRLKQTFLRKFFLADSLQILSEIQLALWSLSQTLSRLSVDSQWTVTCQSPVSVGGGS